MKQAEVLSFATRLIASLACSFQVPSELGSSGSSSSIDIREIVLCVSLALSLFASASARQFCPTNVHR